MAASHSPGTHLIVFLFAFLPQQPLHGILEIPFWLHIKIAFVNMEP